MDFLVRVQNKYAGMTQAERKVLDYLRRDPSKVLTHTLAQLARETKTSEPTIIRVCRQLGYTGYSQLKLMVAMDAGKSSAGAGYLTGDYIICENDSMSGIKTKVVAHTVKALEETEDVLDAGETERAVEAIIHAQRIVFAGVGTSAALAADAFGRMIKLGLNCCLLSDNHLQLMTAVNMHEGDVLIAFSHSGMTKDTVDVAAAAHRGGATVICITNYSESVLTQHSDIKLFTAAYETDFHSESMISRLLQLAVLDVLYLGILLRDPERYAAYDERIQEVLADRAY